MNFGSQSDTITIGNLWCLNHPLRKRYAIPDVVAVPTINTMCANLANRFTITKMTSYPCDFGTLVMKSMHILCYGPIRIDNSCKRRPCFGKRFALLHIHQSLYKLDYILLSARLVVAHLSMKDAQNTLSTRGPEVTPGTCGADGENAQMILVWVRAQDVENASHLQGLGVMRVRTWAMRSSWCDDFRMLKNTSIGGVS